MQRNQDNKPLWINTRGKFTDAHGVKHLPGKTFRADPSEIPKAFRDTIKPFDSKAPRKLPEGAVVPPVPVKKQKPTPSKVKVGNPGFDDPGPETVTKYEIQSRGGSWYDVVNLETKKPMNEKALREDSAKELLKGLCG